MANYGEYIQWGGSAGQAVYYRQPDGSWRNVGAPEHGESAYYVSRGLADPQVDRILALYNADASLLNNEQRAFVASGMVGLDSLGQGYRWGAQNLSDNQFSPQQAGALLQTGYRSYLSPADVEAGKQFNWYESPEQQSIRAGGDDLLGDILPVVALGVGLAGIGGLFAATAEAGAVAAGAELATSAAPLGSLGSGIMGVEIAGAGIYGATPLMAGALGSGLAGIEASAIGLNAGMLATGAAAGAVSSTVTETGISKMDDFLNWYADRESTDPFATTADVNAGWSFDGGYPGVDWYNNAGVGEAPDIWGSLSNAADAAANVTKKIGGILTLGTAALGNAQRNLTQQQPNYTRAAGGMNLGLLAVAVLAWKLL